MNWKRNTQILTLKFQPAILLKIKDIQNQTSIFM